MHIRHFLNRNRYGLLLATILLIMLAGALAVKSRFETEIFLAVLTLNLLSGAFTLYQRTSLPFAFFLIASIAVLGNIASYILPGTGFIVAEALANLVFLGWIMVLIFVHVFTGRTVSGNLLLGGACLYLLLGVSFGYVFMIVDHFVPGSFRGTLPGETDDMSVLFSQFFYYSLVTLATIGYGDIMPISNSARFLSVMEAILAQLYMAILMARLVGLHLSGVKNRDLDR